MNSNRFLAIAQNPLVQIIKEQFRATNIYWLPANQVEHGETKRKINITGIEYVQTQTDGKENEYLMSSLFKAWAAYSGILMKLAPHGLPRELALLPFIYMINIYHSLEKHSGEGVKSYDFHYQSQFGKVGRVN